MACLELFLDSCLFAVLLRTNSSARPTAQEGLNGLADEPSAMEVGPDVLGAGISIASLKSALPGASNATDVGSSVAGTLSPRGSEIARHISIGGMSYDAGAAEDSLPVSPPMSPLPPPSVEGADAGEGKAGEGAEADAAPWAEGQGAYVTTGEDGTLEEVALPGDEAPPAAEPSSPADRPPPAEEESSALTAETATNPDATVRLKPALADTLDDEGSTSEIADQSKAMQSLTGGGADAGPAPAPPSPGQEESDLVVHGDAAGSAGAPKTAVAPLETTAPPAPVPLPDEFAPAWEETFRGLVHADGVDTLGRPVVVLDADAVPRNMKSSAARYVTTHLAGLVERGPYVLVLTARRAALPGMWVMGAYTTLPRPFRKNVKRIVLVRPTPFLRAMLTLLRPLMSAKAARKITQADSLRDVARATEGEVQLDSLGPSFLEHAREELRETAPEEQGDPAP